MSEAKSEKRDDVIETERISGKNSRSHRERDSDVLEIPVGKYLNAVRANPWQLSTVLLGLIVVVFVGMTLLGGKGITGDVISEDVAAEKLLTFINSQGNGEAKLVSVEKSGTLYMVTVNYQSQDIPVFVTLDGTYLITDPIPLGAVPNGAGANSPPQAKGPVDVSFEGAPMQGKADAPVTIVEFSDYECPFCSRFYTDVYSQIKKEYIDTGKVRLAFRDFPLSFHPNAQKASEAARCVRDQKGDEGYFKMHDLLFENQQTLSVENEKKWARTLGVNGATFDSCLDSGKHAKAVQDDLTYGQSIGISGTPTFYVNGQEVVGAQPYSVVKQLIEAELAKTQ